MSTSIVDENIFAHFWLKIFTVHCPSLFFFTAKRGEDYHFLTPLKETSWDIFNCRKRSNFRDIPFPCFVTFFLFLVRKKRSSDDLFDLKVKKRSKLCMPGNFWKEEEEYTPDPWKMLPWNCALLELVFIMYKLYKMLFGGLFRAKHVLYNN